MPIRNLYASAAKAQQPQEPQGLEQQTSGTYGIKLEVKLSWRTNNLNGEPRLSLNQRDKQLNATKRNGKRRTRNLRRWQN